VQVVPTDPDAPANVANPIAPPGNTTDPNSAPVNTTHPILLPRCVRMTSGITPGAVPPHANRPSIGMLSTEHPGEMTEVMACKQVGPRCKANVFAHLSAGNAHASCIAAFFENGDGSGFRNVAICVGIRAELRSPSRQPRHISREPERKWK
jgi:hypothetical protein